MYKTHAGFSFIELVVTVLLISVLLSISVPGSGQHHRNEVDSLSTRIEELFERARGLALYQGQKVIVAVSAETLSIDIAESRELQIAIPPNISIESAHAQFYFGPAGTNTPGTVTIQKDNRRCSLTISLFGKTRRTCTGASND